MSYNKETGMWEGWIYAIKNSINDKLYIGQTRSSIEERWRNHKSNANVEHKQKFAIHLAMNKYGVENFYIESIEKIEKKSKDVLIKELNDKETYYINKFSTICPNGYNLTKGGDSGSIRDFKPALQYDFEGNFLNRYESITLAADMTNGNKKSISACCNHKLKSSGGYVWEYEGVEPRIILSYKDSLYKVDQYTTDGIFIKTYDNAEIAGKDVGIPANNIRSVCSGNAKTAKNYVWRRHGEPYNKFESKQKIRFIGENINQFDFEGKLIATYDEYTRLPNYVINQNVVYECCRGICKYAYGYIWTFGEDKPDIKEIPDSQRPLYAYDLEGKFIERFNNVYEASDVLNIDKTTILNCIQGRNESSGGFMWSITYVDKMNPYKKKQSKGVDKYDYDGNFIRNYRSIKDGTESSEIIKNRKSIENCCKGRIEFTRDGIWRYESDSFDKYSLHKFCIVNKNQDIIYSSLYQKDLAEYLGIDFRTVSSCIKNHIPYNDLYFEIIDVNKSA